MLTVKICGLKTYEEARMAYESGAACVGFLFSEGKRRISIEDGSTIVGKLPPFAVTAGVFVNEPLDFVRKAAKKVGLSILQLHGDESPKYVKEVKEETGLKVIKALRVQESFDGSQTGDYDCDGFLFDAYDRHSYGGTGKTFDWDKFPKDGKGYYILSGGLTPENIKEAVQKTRPDGVCVSSGVEADGQKSFDKINTFIQRAKEGSGVLWKHKQDTSEDLVGNLYQKHLWVP